MNIYLHEQEDHAHMDRLEHKLDAILDGLIVLLDQGETEMADLTALTASVQADGDAVNSAVTLLGSLSQQIRDLSTDPAALQALADQLDANTQSLAEAVVANTPAAPATP